MSWTKALDHYPLKKADNISSGTPLATNPQQQQKYPFTFSMRDASILPPSLLREPGIFLLLHFLIIRQSGSSFNKSSPHMWWVGDNQLLLNPTETRAEGLEVSYSIQQMHSLWRHSLGVWTGEQCLPFRGILGRPSPPVGIVGMQAFLKKCSLTFPSDLYTAFLLILPFLSLGPLSLFPCLP